MRQELTGMIARNMSRSNMDELLMDLLREDAITLEELSDFSEELQERLRWFVKAEERWKNDGTQM